MLIFFFVLGRCVVHLIISLQRCSAKKATATRLMYGQWDASCTVYFTTMRYRVIRSPELIIFFRYTLLVGRPPFETQSLKDTYSKIKRNEYHIPSRIGPLARALITRMLQGEPHLR